MRIYRVKRVRREWTDLDRSTARNMRSEGASIEEIALSLNRKLGAVRAWLHHNCKIWHEPETVEYQRALIAHADVAEWYELGWRVESISNDLVIVEWRSSRIARIPKSVSEQLGIAA